MCSQPPNSSSSSCCRGMGWAARCPGLSCAQGCSPALLGAPRHHSAHQAPGAAVGQGQGQGSPPAAEGGGCPATRTAWGWRQRGSCGGSSRCQPQAAPPACAPRGRGDPVPPGRGSARSSVGTWPCLVPLRCSGTQCTERRVGARAWSMGKGDVPPPQKKAPGGGATAAGDLVQRPLWQLTAGVRGAQSCGEQSPAGSAVPVTTQHPAGPRVGPGCRPWHRGSSLRWPGQGWGRGTSTRRRARPDQRRTVPVAAHPEHDRGSPRGPGPAWAAVAGLGPVARLWMRLQCPEQWPPKASPWPAGTNVQHADVCLGHPPLERHGDAVGGARGLVMGGQRHGHEWCWSCIQGAAAGCCRPAAGQSGPGSGSSPGSSRRGAAGPGRCPVIVLGGIRRAGRGWPQECGGSTGAGAAEPAHAQAPIGARR